MCTFCVTSGLRSRAKITTPIKIRPVLCRKLARKQSRNLRYAWDSRFDVAKNDSCILSKDQSRNSVGLLFILCGIFGKISVRFRFWNSPKCLAYFFFKHKQDLFAVSCFLPLLTHRARELGASPSIVGVIGMYWSVIKALVILSLCTQQRVVYGCGDYNLQVCIHLLI